MSVVNGVNSIAYGALKLAVGGHNLETMDDQAGAQFKLFNWDFR